MKILRECQENVKVGGEILRECQENVKVGEKMNNILTNEKKSDQKALSKKRSDIKTPED